MRQWCLLLVMALLLVCMSGCRDNENTTSGAGHSFAYALVHNPDTLDPQLAVNDSAKTVLANLFEGLFVIGADGSVQNGVVSSYTVSEDGLVYTFQLREDCYWHQAIGEDSAYDKEDEVRVTAPDFVYAFQRLFDPTYASPYREQFRCIAHADEILLGQQDSSMIGVYARTDTVLEITLAYPNADLPMLLTSTAALPCHQAFFESTKGRYGLDEASIIGNGSFSMQRWLYDPYGTHNVIQMVRNPLNHKVHRVSPADLTFYIEENEQDAAKLFTNEKTDCYVTTQTALLSHAGVQAQGAYSLTLALAANPESPYANLNVRKAMAWSLDRTQLIPETDDVRIAYGILPPAVQLLNKSVRELIADSAYRNYDVTAAKTALHAELDALGISELEEGRILVPAGLMEYDLLLDVLEQWHTVLDLHLSIDEVSQDAYEKRLAAGDYQLILLGLTGENRDAAAVLQAFCSNPAVSCEQESRIYTMIEEIAETQNHNERIERYRDAETSLLADYCVLPLFYKQRYVLSRTGVSDVVFNPFSGQLQFRDAKYDEP